MCALSGVEPRAPISAAPPLVSRELSLTDTEYSRKLRLFDPEPPNLPYATSDGLPVDLDSCRSGHLEVDQVSLCI